MRPDTRTGNAWMIGQDHDRALGIEKADEIARNWLRLQREYCGGHDLRVQNPYDIAFGTTAAIANDCSVSTPTIVRLAQTLGFEGFREMREFFRQGA